jgi:hypothetical protein
MMLREMHLISLSSGESKFPTCGVSILSIANKFVPAIIVTILPDTKVPRKISLKEKLLLSNLQIN